MPNFKNALILLFLLMYAAGSALAQPDDDSRWLTFKSRFISAQGRVIDDKQDGISHSEGQGYGLLFAAAFRDRTAFELIWQWTHTNLQVRKDALLAWKWVPSSANHVPDHNDAADGDILAAWALARAGQTFHEPRWTAAAKEIAQDVRKELIQTVGGRMVLVPGANGFLSGEGVVINLSYWIFPALPTLNRIDPSQQWAELENSGLALLSEAQFGQWKLPPDWLGISPNGKLYLPANRPQRFSYDAIRIPLYLIWAGLGTSVRLQPYLSFWNEFTKVPFVGAWTNLDDNSIASYGPPPGFRAVRDLVIANQANTPYHVPQISEKDDYYSAALILLTDLAAKERSKQ
jgi:endo-1,4-beta-D-glucanase Y